MTSSWELWPRDGNLGRTYDPASGWADLTIIERHNVNDSWTVEGPAATLAVFEPGSGSVLVEGGQQVTAGQVVALGRGTKSGRDWMAVTFASDLVELGGRVVVPDPTFVLTGAVQMFPTSHDERTGTAEDLILEYVAASIGATAQTVRRLPGLALPVSAHRGATSTVKARFDTLGTLVQDIAEPAGLRVRTEHAETTGVATIALLIDTVMDVSADVVFGPASSAATGLIDSWWYQLARPTITHALVLGGDEQEARKVVLVADDDAAALWGRRIEGAVDQRQTVDPDALAGAGVGALDDAAGTSTVELGVRDSSEVRYRRDYAVGSVVGIALPGWPQGISAQPVRQVTTKVTRRRGQATQTRAVVLGSREATTTQTRASRDIARAMRRLAQLERST